MANYSDHWFRSSDGLKLYARDYQHSNPIATILCIPGLTRNSADFSILCEQLNKDYRVLAIDLRGRGKSAYDSNHSNYHPGIYCADVISLLDSLEQESVILIGTSLGGLISMILAITHPDRVTAAVLNDIGPEVNKTGLDRILTYVSNTSPVDSWLEAISKTKLYLSRDYPNFTDDDWSEYTKNLYTENDDSKPTLSFDKNISVLLLESQNNAIPPDLWPMFSGIQSTPLLLIRGELSEVLSKECAEKMQEINPAMEYVEVSNCGHTPLLTETVCTKAINSFLAKLN